MSNSPLITVDDLIARGPQAVRDFLSRKHTRDEFDPKFSWLLLADVIAFHSGYVHRTDPPPAAQWAEIAADLYE